MDKERTVNIRFLFCVFIGLMLGIVFSMLFLLSKIDAVIYIFTFFIIISFSVFFIIYSCKTSKENLKFRARKNISYLILCSAIGFAIAYIVGMIICVFPIVKIKNNYCFEEYVSVSGVVTDFVDREESYTKFVLSDCEYYENDQSVLSDFKVIVYTSGSVDICLGDQIGFNSTLDNFDYLEEYDFSQLSQGVAYSTYVNAEDLVVNKGNPSFRDRVHILVKDILKSNLNEDNSEICFAVLFGQKYGLSQSISDMFSYAGISHILAVSGLHIGVLVSVLWFVLNKIKMNKYVKLVLFGFVLLFYSYLCMFSPSVCRASIMAFVLALCKVFFWEYDSLSSLSIAGIVILLFNPLALFTVSFQLSFMCVFAIITLAPSIQKLFDKIKIPKVLSSTLAMSIAVNVVILPICMNYFSSVSMLGIITNIIVLPIFSIMYILLFSIILLSLIIRPLGVFLVIPNLFLQIIKSIALIVFKIPWGVFNLFKTSYMIVFFAMLTTLTLHFYMVKTWWKFIWVGVLSSVAIIMLVISTIPQKYDQDSFLIVRQNNSNIVVYVSNNQVTLIGSDISYKNLRFIMRELKIKKIDNVIAYDLQLNKLNELNNAKEFFDIDRLVILEELNYDEITSDWKYIDTIKDHNVYALNNLSLHTIEYNGDEVALSIKIDDTDFLIPFMNNSLKENNYLIENYSNFDYYLIDNKNVWQAQDNISGMLIDITNCEDMLIRQGEIYEI